MPGICYQFAESGSCNYGSQCKFPHVLNIKAPKNAKGTATSVKKKSKNKAPKTRDGMDPLDAFFARYPSFDYRPKCSSTEEFYRMCDFFDWDRDDLERAEAHDEFKTALVKQFNTLYGTEVDSIESWRGLSVALGIWPLPENVNEAKKMFEGKFVNLVDLVDTRSTGQSVTQFRNLEDLKEYTISTGKYFPKESAYAGGMLKFLLREILNKHEGQGSRRRRR